MSKPVSSSALISRRFAMWWERRGRSLAPLYCALAAGVALVATGCTNLEATAPSVSRIPSPGNTAVLNHGRELYLGKCTACHVAEPVAKYSAARWPGIIREMSIETKLTAAEEQAVLAYVMAALRAPALQ